MNKPLDNIANKFFEKLPDELKQGKAGIESNLRQSLAKIIAKLDLVSREEFDAQNKVLSRAEAHIEQLEARLAALEKTE